MNRSENRLLTTILVAGFLAIIAFAGKQGGSPQTTSNVLVTNAGTQPVPTYYPHTPTVAALQSGTWKINGITNVHVFNDATAPVPDKDVDNIARNAFNTYLSFSINAGDSESATTLSGPAAGKRMVITHVAFTSQAQAGVSCNSFSVGVLSGAGTGQRSTETGPMKAFDGQALIAGGDQSMFVIADPGDTIYIYAYRAPQADLSGSVTVQVTLEGFYVTQK